MTNTIKQDTKLSFPCTCNGCRNYPTRPAEIWHEVMVRVNEGLPVSDLPMMIPEPRLPPGPEYPEYVEDPLPDAMQAPLPERRQSQDPVEALLRDILGLN